MAAKDFGSIENDYAFFMAHATEAENDAAEYLRALSGFANGRISIRLLDFGCGAGDFTHRLASALNWRPETLRWTLVEPVRHHREAAARRLTQFSRHPIDCFEKLPAAPLPRFDLVLSNHALYYVDDLGATLAQMFESLDAHGKMLLAIAGRDNPLIQLWQVGFALLGRPVPYRTAEDVEAILRHRGARIEISQVPYQIRFPDSMENRRRILHFLFGDYLRDIPTERLIGEFDRFLRGGHIEIDAHSRHFTLVAAANPTA